MIGMIAAVTRNGVIGVDGKIPFDYPEDMAHFKKTTLNSTIIMGRKTFEGIGKPLPKRKNIVITSQKIDIPGIKTYSSLADAISMENLTLKDAPKDIWLIGGAKIYEAGMSHADKILLTITSEYNLSDKTIRFPWINPCMFKSHHLTNLELSEDTKRKSGHPYPQLAVYEYIRI